MRLALILFALSMLSASAFAQSSPYFTTPSKDMQVINSARCLYGPGFEVCQNPSTLTLDAKIKPESEAAVFLTSLIQYAQSIGIIVVLKGETKR